MSKAVMVKVQINIPAQGGLDEINKVTAIEELAKNLTTENLLLLAEKSRKPFINTTIQTFKNLI